MESARRGIKNDRLRERRRQEAETRDARQTLQQPPRSGTALNGHPTSNLHFQSTPPPPRETSPRLLPGINAPIAPTTEQIRNFSGLVDDKLLSGIPMSKFMDMNVQFRWPDNINASEMDHRDFRDSRMFPCNTEGIIGKTRSCRVFTWKTDRSENGFDDRVAIKQLPPSTREDERRLKAKLGQSERKILKSLSHIHVVAFLGSFTWLDNYHIITYPVAKWHLLKYMKTASDPQSDPAPDFPHRKRVAMLEKLRGFMPCLCEAVSYLHSERAVRHKDIKPTNILVDNFDNVLLTDFGISTQYSSPGNMESTGANPPQTMQYAAPEVLHSDRRGLQSDVFSLACVFLEMCTVLCGLDLNELYLGIGFTRPKKSSGPENDRPDPEGKYALSLPQLSIFIDDLKRGIASSTAAEDGAYKPTVDIMTEVSRMLHEDPQERPQLTVVSQTLKIKDQRCRCQDRRPSALATVFRDTRSIDSLGSIEEEIPTDAGLVDTPLPTTISVQDWAHVENDSVPSSRDSTDAQAGQSPQITKARNGRPKGADRAQNDDSRLRKPEYQRSLRGKPSQLKAKPQSTAVEQGAAMTKAHLNGDHGRPEANQAKAAVGQPATRKLSPKQRMFNYYRQLDSNLTRSNLRGTALRYNYTSKEIEFIQLETFGWDPEGFLLRLPNDWSGQFHLPSKDGVEVVNLWDQISFWSNVRRMTRWPGWPASLKYVWVTGSDLTEDQLENFVGEGKKPIEELLVDN